MIKQALESLLLRSESSPPRLGGGGLGGGHAGGFSGSAAASAISGILSDCIARFDHSITHDFTRIFPGGPAALQGMSSSQIRHLFQDRGMMSGGPPGSQQDIMTAVTRCLQGSTVVVTLTDPSKHNLWIANLGDSQTGKCYIIGSLDLPVLSSTRTSSSNLTLFLFLFFNIKKTLVFLVLASRTHAAGWSSTFVTTPHDGNNRSEALRIRNQHPGEPECLQDNRILGFLGPTRCKQFLCLFLKYILRSGNSLLIKS
jgi:pyruvate dehydrogenase phosphatase